ncbi:MULTISPECIES: WxL domain-containing protein [Carnobacterium]|uniref:WxL domain-containing protein n=1 Tax=Carnobacterium TaxID=2747 RepID=UPI00288F9B4B|nr:MULTISPECIES: WxL domain-containing protein [Carnobacterium]MDT1940383.1 WxL domain-containing protein [Carnobacterium divergens]MDT1942821.1 WxL domain-containing protein [Carnobacterium divergens]MDT1948627.1 WxL domain-containing protein [Carnobacterium divergens]MDT1951108.1 WxL domain-containing protein [Carnobacterium divergens]MDT1956166.1 WxL domain-containing protein [Carnobacterium divergens]
MKMTKTAIFSLATFATVTLGGTPVLAATVGVMNSNTDIIFQAETSITDPTNPLIPGTPVTPNPSDPHEPGTAGPLSIDYVSNFHFGTATIDDADKIYYAQLDSVVDKTTGLPLQVPNYVQVTDKRGNNAGWKLLVKQNGQFKTTDTNKTPLDNAQLHLSAGTPLSVVPILFSPTTTAVNLDPTGAASSTVMTAVANKGFGTWTSSFGADNVGGLTGVSLNIPMVSTKVSNVQYKTTLTWNLEDSPN